MSKTMWIRNTMREMSTTPTNESILWQRVVLLWVLAYESLGCLSGGVCLVIAPDGRLMKMSVQVLRGVFPNFLIPGMILLVLGILNVIAFVSVLRRSHTDWVWALLAQGGLAIWFWVEIIVLRELHWLHAMWGLPVVIGTILAILSMPGNVTKGLMLAGAFSSLVYLAADIIASNLWIEYSFTDQAFSELTAAEAPTRNFMVAAVGFPYSLLIIAFAVGVWLVSNQDEARGRLRTLSLLLLLYAICGFAGGTMYPMHSRGVSTQLTLADLLHIRLTMLEVMSMLVILVIGASLFYRRFRVYTVFTIALLLGGGLMASLYAPRIAMNLPTPGLGIIERLNIYGFMVWIVVFALTLVKRQGGSVAHEVRP